MTCRLLGKYDEADQWLRPVLAWAERLGDHRGNKNEGLRLLKRARDEYKTAGFDESWKEVWDNINARIKAVSQ